jgi:hypothetical protein
MEQDNEAKINWENFLIQGAPLFDIGIPRKKMISLIKYAYQSFYFRPRYIWQRLKKIFRSPLREARIDIKGFLMVFSYFKRW